MSGMLLPSKSSSFLFCFFSSFSQGWSSWWWWWWCRYSDVQPCPECCCHQSHHDEEDIIFFFPFSLNFLLFFFSSFFLKDDHHGGDGGDDDVNSENYDCFEDARECNCKEGGNHSKTCGYKIDMKIYRMSPKKKLTECCCSHQIQNQNWVLWGQIFPWTWHDNLSGIC